MEDPVPPPGDLLTPPGPVSPARGPDPGPANPEEPEVEETSLGDFMDQIRAGYALDKVFTHNRFTKKLILTDGISKPGHQILVHPHYDAIKTSKPIVQLLRGSAAEHTLEQLQGARSMGHA